MDSINENDELLKVKLHKEKIISNRVKLEYLTENFIKIFIKNYTTTIKRINKILV